MLSIPVTKEMNKHNLNKNQLVIDGQTFNSKSEYLEFYNKIDIIQLNQCAKELIGEHNFSMLSKKNTETTNKICTIYESYWEDDKNQLIYTIKGNRFLHHMVRFIIGTSIEVAKSKISFNDFVNLINNDSSLSPVCAPASALFLFEVLYD